MASGPQTQWDFGLDENVSSEKRDSTPAEEYDENLQQRASDETEELLQQLLSLEKEKIRLAKSKGQLTLQQLQSRVANLQQDIVSLKEPNETSHRISKPPKAERLLSHDSSIADSSIDNEYEDLEGDEEDGLSVSSPHDGKHNIKPKRLDKLLHRHSESSATPLIHSSTATASSSSSIPNRPSSFRATSQQQFHSGLTNSSASSFRINHHRYTTQGSSSNASANNNNSVVTPLITMPNALNYAVTLRDKRQHATNIASTFSPEASVGTSAQSNQPPSSPSATQSSASNKSATGDIGGVGSRDRRSSIHAVQARYSRSGPSNSSTSAGQMNASAAHLNPTSSPATTAEALLMMKNSEQGHYFSDSASDYSANSRSVSVDRPLSPEHHHVLPPSAHPHPNTFLHSTVNDHNASHHASHRQDSVSTTSSSATSLLQDQSNFLDPDFTHIYNSPHKTPAHASANNASNSTSASKERNILEFCMVEADWQYLRRLHSATDPTALSASSVAAAMASPSHGTSSATSGANKIDSNINRTNNAAAHLKSMNSFVPPSMIDRFPPDIIHDTTSHTRDIQEQSFFFPSGVHLEITSQSIRDVTTRPYYHKRHIVPFANRDGIPLYACCLTVQQSYTLEEIYAIDPGIVAHLVSQYQAKYASISIQRAYRAYVVWKKQQAWTQQLQTQLKSTNKSSTNASTTAATASSSSFFGSKATSNNNVTPRTQSVTSSSFFGHYSSSTANSNSNSNNNINQKMSGKGSEAGSLGGSMHGGGVYSPTNAQLTQLHQQQQQLLAQHQMKTSSMHKELLHSSTSSTASTATASTTASTVKSTSLFSRLFRSSSASNAVVSQAASAADNSTAGGVSTPAAGVAITPGVTMSSSSSSSSSSVETKQVGALVQPVGLFSPLGDSTNQSTSASTTATVAATPPTPSVASRLSFFHRTSITATTTSTTAPPTPQPPSAKALDSDGKVGDSAIASVQKLSLTMAENQSTTSNVMSGSTPVTPHRHARVRLPSDRNRSFDQDEEKDDDDDDDDEDKSEDEADDEETEGMKKELGDDNITDTMSSPVDLSPAADSVTKRESSSEVNKEPINEGLPSESARVDLSSPMPTNPDVSVGTSTYPSYYQSYSHTQHQKKPSHYCSRFNLIHDSTFFFDKVIVGQRCYCLISPLPEYTFLFTMLDILAQAENNKVSAGSSNSSSGIYSSPSPSPGSHHASPEQRHHFLYQIGEYMQRMWARPGHVLHVQDFAFNFAVTQDLQLSGIRNRVLEKLAFRKHHHHQHHHLLTNNNTNSTDNTNIKKTASDESSLSRSPSGNNARDKAEEALSAGREALIASASSTSSDRLSQLVPAVKPAASAPAAAAKKYAFRVRDYVKIPHSYVDALLPTSEWALAVLITHVSAPTIFKMVNLLLMEKSLIIYGQNAGVVTAITFAIAQLLSPFLWEGIFIPLVPDNAREMFGAPVPLLLGTISPPRLADVSSSTAVLHVNDHMATIYYDNCPVATTTASIVHSRHPSTSVQPSVPAARTAIQNSVVPVEEKLARIKSIEFTAWFVRLPEVTADLPIDSEIVKRIEYTRRLLGQFAKDGVHVCYPWRELVASYSVPKSQRRSSTASYPTSSHQPEASSSTSATNSSNTEDARPSVNGRNQKVLPLKDETLEVHNQIDRLFLSHMPVIIRSQLRIILSVMKRYNATMCGTDLFYDDPSTWKRFLRLNPVTQTEEFYPDNYLEPLRSKLEFQDAMVHTQLFVSFMDRMRREAAVLDQVREFIGHWIYCRIVVKRAQQRRKDPKARFRSFLSSK
jgi:hypothetical protein